MTAVDTTVSLTSAQIAGLRAAGVTAVSRYIAPQSWKRITLQEYDRIIAGGLQVSLNWESGAQDLKFMDSATTASYAHQAVQQAQACGYPAGCVILNSADWDVTAGDWPHVAGNLRAIRPIYRAAGYGLGLYAPWDALGWAQRDRLVDVYWQAGMSTSWSGGRNRNPWPGAHLRQRRSTSIAGVALDVSDILIPAFGQAGAGAPTPGGTTMTNPTVEDLMNRTINGRRIADILGEEDGSNDTIRAIAGIVAEVDAKLDTVLAAIKAIPAPAGGTAVTGGGPLTITLTGTATPAV